ncbi:hypothetical protein M2389_000990 [Microbacterium phyllosphaerae]|nr:hypothetical protein [Microbacterium phyllosphaerae]
MDALTLFAIVLTVLALSLGAISTWAQYRVNETVRELAHMLQEK